jgi:hypothetical protein
MPWQVSLEDAKRQAQERMEGRPALWWVTLDEPTDEIWASTPESGDGWSLCAFAQALYGNGRRFSVERTTDPRVALIRLEVPVEHLVVFEEGMPAVMRSLRAYCQHGKYRKAGTEKEYRF